MSKQLGIFANRNYIKKNTSECRGNSSLFYFERIDVTPSLNQLRSKVLGYDWYAALQYRFIRKTLLKIRCNSERPLEFLDKKAAVAKVIMRSVSI